MKSRNRKKYHHFILISKVIADVLAVFGGITFSFVLLSLFSPISAAETFWSNIELFSLWAVFISLVVFDLIGLYRFEISFLNFEETRKVIGGLFIIFLIIFPGFALVSSQLAVWPLFSIVSFSFIFTFLFIVAEKTIFYKLAKYNFKNGKYVKRVVIYDACPTGRLILKKLAELPQLGFRPIGFLDNKLKAGEMISTNSEQIKIDVPILGKMKDLVLLAKKMEIEEVFVATPAIQTGEMKNIIRACQMAEIGYQFVPNLLDEPLHHAVMHSVGNVPFITIEEPRINWLTKIIKRLVDIVFSALILIISAPFLALIAVAIKRDSKGPIIFRQVRIGKNGQPFTMYKFRTMKVRSPKYAYSPKNLNDPRITKVGKFLRRTSMDELPQFFNVLKNDMSIVGPRPEMPYIVEGYNEVQKERLLVKPGITGLWQITLDRSRLIHENLDYDIYYIKNISVLLDILIIIKTVWFAIRGVAAY